MLDNEQPLWRGRATPAATAARARSFGTEPRALARTGLWTAPVGFGAYRVHVESNLHRQALEEALRAGVNLIDTSANYGDGGSELLIGRVLGAMLRAGDLTREEVVVVTKAGYIQGTALELAHARDAPYPEVVEYQPTCWHCIHPDFLADQIALSRQRLGVETLDVLLLHNPEYFLVDRQTRAGVVTEDDRVELDRRLRRAFEFLEGAVDRGEIAWYGVSSNTFVEPPDRPEHLSLSRIYPLAGEHFGVVELPLNLYELGALSAAHGEAPLALARRLDLAVLTNRPLNAFLDGEEPRMLRLADTSGPKDRPRDPTPVLREVQRLEERWTRGLGARLADEYGDPVRNLLRWGTELHEGLPQIHDLGHWLHLRNAVIAGHISQIESTFLGTLEAPLLGEFRDFWESYTAQLLAALDAVEDDFRARALAVLDAVGDRLAGVTPAAWRNLPLARRAVLTLLALPVSCVLVGMRRPAYVHDIAAIPDARPRPGLGAGRVEPDALLTAFGKRH